MCRKQRSKLTSSHNLPPAEANKGRREFRGTPPRPRQEASPPAPPIYDWMSVEDKDIVSMSIRARNTCRRDICWLRGFVVPAHAWCDHTTAHPNLTSNEWRNFP